MNEFLTKTKYDINDIIKILPHRYPFILIDRILEVVPGESATAIKNVTVNEPHFPGHFPGQPVMPGVLSLEAIAQTTAFLMLYNIEEPLKKNMLISGFDKVRFRRLITPGDQLVIKVEIQKSRLNLFKFHGKITIDNQPTVEALVSSNLVDRAEV